MLQLCCRPQLTVSNPVLENSSKSDELGRSGLSEGGCSARAGKSSQSDKKDSACEDSHCHLRVGSTTVR